MKSRILIVEDNVTLSQMQKDWLAREGYEVTTAIDAVVARRHIRKVDFDLILSDVRLPVQSEKRNVVSRKNET